MMEFYPKWMDWPKPHCTSCDFLGTIVVENVHRAIYRCGRSRVVHYIAQHGPGPHDAVSVPMDCLLSMSACESQLLAALYWIAVLETQTAGGLEQGFGLIQSGPGDPVVLVFSPFLNPDERGAIHSAATVVLNGFPGKPDTDDELRRLESGVLAELAQISAVGGPDRWARPVTA